MKILTVDTTLAACSVALLDGTNVLAHRLEAMERGHAEALAPMVQSVVSEACLDFTDLQRLAVTTGPGTFTGQRVGLAFMRGLRIALKLPLLGITSLEAMAAAAIEQNEASFVAVLHDARRDEVYAGFYVPNHVLLEPTLLSIEDAVQTVQRMSTSNTDTVVFAGTAGKKACAAYAGRGGQAVVSSVIAPDALQVARLALARPDPGVAPAPLYLRPPDARVSGPS